MLLDEIGRGTSTFDGLALAWSCASHLAREVRCFTLFATHYFELTNLPETISGVENVHLDAVEHGENIVFLHALNEGPANQSYGLHVAQLAGVPRIVIQKAKQKLRQLEEQSIQSMLAESPQQADLFSQADKPAPISPAVETLRGLELDKLTPRQALELLYQLQDMV